MVKLAGLRSEKKKLLKLIQKQSIERLKIRRAREEEAKLRKEVRRLRKIAARKVSRKKEVVKSLIRKAKSPEARERLREIGSKIKKGFRAFQKFADKHG